MESDETRRAEALDRYWDALRRGEQPARPPEIGEAMATLARHWSTTPPGTDAARDRVWRALRAQMDIGPREQEPPMSETVRLDLPRIAPISNGRTDPHHGWPTSSTTTRLNDGYRLDGRDARSGLQERRWRLAAGAIAALLLILGTGYVVFRSELLDDEHTTVPAAVAPTATPTPGVVSDETLLVYTIPAAELPRINIGIGTTRNTIAPGHRSTWDPYCCPGPMLEYVLAGTYTVRAEAPIQIIRADGTSETVPAGVEVTLGPGDALISRNETVVEAANTGADTVHLINWTLIENTEDAGFYGHLLPGWTNNDPDVKGASSLGDGPVTVTVRRVELSPGATFSPNVNGVFQFTVPMPQNAAGTPVASYAVREADGTIRIVGNDAYAIYVLTLEPSGDAAGSPVADNPPP